MNGIGPGTGRIFFSYLHLWHNHSPLGTSSSSRGGSLRTDRRTKCITKLPNAKYNYVNIKSKHRRSHYFILLVYIYNYYDHEIVENVKYSAEQLILLSVLPVISSFTTTLDHDHDQRFINIHKKFWNTSSCTGAHIFYQLISSSIHNAETDLLALKMESGWTMITTQQITALLTAVTCVMVLSWSDPVSLISFTLCLTLLPYSFITHRWSNKLLNMLTTEQQGQYRNKITVLMIKVVKRSKIYLHQTAGGASQVILYIRRSSHNLVGFYNTERKFTDTDFHWTKC